MAISFRHPIRSKIEDQASFISILLQEYPHLLEMFEKDVINKIEHYADECAEGDNEIRSMVLTQCLNSLDNDDLKKDIFYQSLLLMAFSYYESSISLLSVNANAKEHISAICKSKNISLSLETQADINYLQEDINALRNNICHNNMGTHRNIDILKRIAKTWKGVVYEDDKITLTDSAIIEDALKKMKNVLDELCDKLGYKNRII